ncbi:transcriptional regulator, winged helix family [Catenulispora acidiphila DSM 44928]|uniref:Transcriptional regulator, winged helix family n=1 Tax=Catenulispora acidiphila (strain DSM 44928 / JCM 14897 / NBRC 102108 / NRRL B-24433 / ID139908) TaxID=479433 RepID=C7PZK3_CATAD|nr:BTAD domain-containing putative transcriptional regulator [Catenulispora acidiphila]ACU73518.1 transcriptional regulator, winged helix family [Catenulispora acidiphila DSM 44928]
MSIALRLLDDVRWHGVAVVGERPQALLAALAARQGRAVGAAELIEAVWGDAAPSNGVKSLQVLVSRTRSACGPEVIVRDGTGYRLGVGPGEVDSTELSRLVREATAALDTDAARAAELAQQALTVVGGQDAADSAAAATGAVILTSASEDDGPLAEIRHTAAAQLAAARTVAARAASRTGAHAQALPQLESAHADAAHDESLLADLLRSEAAVRGPAAALERFERHRRDLRERFGSDPGEVLQRVQRALLALDRPVRHGLRYDATELIGRDADVARLRTALAASRVVSIVGPGGLGKTRLAQVMARQAEQPAVYFVELAGVLPDEDLAVEVGSVLGVRDSVSGRAALTPRQRADFTARIAQQLAQVPGLLVLDNCEHLIGAVADLVAFLIAATPDLRVLTTSRAPLAIAAERLYPLGELGTADGVQLFAERALAARPDARLDADVVAGIVRRLDGLPLAIELAAAKVRVMAVEDIDRRLADRFALLRGGDRSAPDRHQGLLTVIEWSWNLLGEAEKQALRRLALFHDGFTPQAAEAVLPPAVFDAVPGLVDQSLVTVRESAAGIRYRMLETVREFGRMQLAAAGEQDQARAAQRRWAVRYVSAQRLAFSGPGQFAAIDAVSVEETNLADELRGAIAEGDRESLVTLLAGLGTMWMMRGEHFRLLVLGGAVRDALSDWTPPPHLADATRAAVAITLNNALALSGDHGADLFALLHRLGPASGEDIYLAALVEVLLTCAPAVDAAFPARLCALAAGADRHTAGVASLWLSRHFENEGDLPAALAAAERVLALAESDAADGVQAGPWTTAMPHALLAELTMQLGDSTAAITHAKAALPVVERLGANDDEAQLRALLVLCDIGAGRLARAAEQLGRIDSIEMRAASFGTDVFRHICRAELLLASGQIADGLRLYRESSARMRQRQVPEAMRTGTELWSYFGDALVLNAHAWYAADAEELACGQAKFTACRASALKVLTADNERLDYPAAGLLLFALGAWALLRKAAAATDAVRLLALAQRFAYNRMLPTMAWDRILAAAKEALPGALEQMSAEYADRRPPDLLEQARAAARRLPEESEGS